MPEAESGPLPTHAPPPQVGLEERERIILAELARELDAWVSFQGLRRQLGVHQQALARTLRRLESQGLVSRDAKGYQLTDAGLSAIGAAMRREAEQARLHGEPVPAAVVPGERPVIPVVQAILPPYVQPGDVAAQLARRWFGGLRWYGQSVGPGETSLHWLADRAKVTVRVAPGSVTLEVEDTPDTPHAAFAAARPVLAALAEIYGVGAS